MEKELEFKAGKPHEGAVTFDQSVVFSKKDRESKPTAITLWHDSQFLVDIEIFYEKTSMRLLSKKVDLQGLQGVPVWQKKGEDIISLIAYVKDGFVCGLCVETKDRSDDFSLAEQYEQVVLRPGFEEQKGKQEEEKGGQKQEQKEFLRAIQFTISEKHIDSISAYFAPLSQKQIMIKKQEEEFKVAQYQINEKSSAALNKLVNSNQNVGLSVSAVKDLISLTPKETDVKNDEHKKMYKELIEEAENILQNKSLLTDKYQELNTVVNKIASRFSKIIELLKPIMSNVMYTFSASFFKNEIKGLNEMKKETLDILARMREFQASLQKMRKTLNKSKTVKEKVASEDTVNRIIESFSFSKEESDYAAAVNAIKKDISKFSLEISEGEGHLQLLQDKINSLEEEAAEFEEERKNTEEKAKEAADELPQEILEMKKNSQEVQQNMLKAIQAKYNTLSEDNTTKHKEVESKFRAEREELRKRVSNMKMEHKAFHFIFVLDESGSMSRSWKTLQQSYDEFIATRKGYTSKDVVSTILFNDNAKIHCQKTPIDKVSPLPSLRGGGTDFEPAFKLTEDIIQLTPTDFTPVIIFLTDGESYGDLNNVYSILSSMRTKYQKQKMLLFAIGFGECFNKEVLNKICEHANGSLILKLPEDTYGFVNTAKDQNALRELFGVLANLLDTQSAAITKMLEFLKKQEEDEQKLFQSKEEFISKKKEKEIKDLEAFNTNAAANDLEKMKILYIESHKKNTELIVARAAELNKELEKEREKQSKVRAILDTARANLREKEEFLEKTNKTAENVQNLEDIRLKKGDEQINAYLNMTGFTKLEQLRKFAKFLDAPTDTLETYINSTYAAVTFIEQMKEQLDETIFALSGKRDSSEIISQEEIFALAYQYYEDVEKMTFEGISKFDNIRIICDRINKKCFEGLKEYFDKLFYQLNLMKLVATEEDDELKEMAEELVQYVIEEDDDDEDEDELTEMQEAIEEFKKEIKDVKQKMKETKDKDEIKEFKAEVDELTKKKKEQETNLKAKKVQLKKEKKAKELAQDEEKVAKKIYDLLKIVKEALNRPAKEISKRMTKTFLNLNYDQLTCRTLPTISACSSSLESLMEQQEKEKAKLGGQKELMAIETA